MTTSEAMRSHAKPRHRHGEVRRQHREEQQSGHQSDDLRQLHNSTSAKNDDSGKEKVRRDLLYVEIWTVHVTSITFTMTWMTWMTSYHGQWHMMTSYICHISGRSHFASSVLQLLGTTVMWAFCERFEKSLFRVDTTWQRNKKKQKKKKKQGKRT